MFRREFLRRVGMAAMAAGFLRMTPIEWGADKSFASAAGRVIADEVIRGFPPEVLERHAMEMRADMDAKIIAGFVHG